MIAEKDPYIKSAYRQLQVISQDKEKQLEYEAREKAIRDYNQGMFEARQSGWEEGIKKGKEDGIREGMDRVCRLYNLLIQNKRFEDLARSANDPDYRDKLFREYGIQDKN